MILLAVLVGFGLAMIGYKVFRGFTPAEEASEMLQCIMDKQEQILATLDEVVQSVSELPSIGDSLDAVFAKLQELISAGQQDPAKLSEALTMVTTQKDRLKAAIVANTPAAAGGTGGGVVGGGAGDSGGVDPNQPISDTNPARDISGGASFRSNKFNNR